MRCLVFYLIIVDTSFFFLLRVQTIYSLAAVDKEFKIMSEVGVCQTTATFCIWYTTPENCWGRSEITAFRLHKHVPFAFL